MHLHFKPVTRENRSAVEALALYPEQAGYIKSPAECLRECLFATDVLVAAALFVTYGCFSLIPQRKRLSACTGRTVLNRR